MNRSVSVIGLGYVGLPVAVAFGKYQKVIAFDVKKERLEELKNGYDRTGEVSPEELKNTQLFFTNNAQDLRAADFHIIAVPTPINEANQPDLGPLQKASWIVGSILKKGDIVVYESTVYPGATEEDCLPILEQASGLKGGIDFTLGYSPERINPGDKNHSLSSILKIVSGQDSQTLEIVAQVYETIIEAGVYRAKSIKTAEAAKIIENTQRDLNIALMNELAILFEKLGLDTLDVLEAAGTKWNFLPFRPGLVGGHCIGVDPYYLTYKAERVGYHPQVILAGRRINNMMPSFIAQKTIQEMIRLGHYIPRNRITILGLTFKEDCPDIRNTKVIELIEALKEWGVDLQICDPLAHPDEAQSYYGVNLTPLSQLKPAQAVVVAVAHRAFKNLDFSAFVEKPGLIVDVKGIVPQAVQKDQELRVWRL